MIKLKRLGFALLSSLIVFIISPHIFGLIPMFDTPKNLNYIVGWTCALTYVFAGNELFNVIFPKQVKYAIKFEKDDGSVFYLKSLNPHEQVKSNEMLDAHTFDDRNNALKELKNILCNDPYNHLNYVYAEVVVYGGKF